MVRLRQIPCGKRRRGRPRTKWTDVIQRDLLNLGFGWSIEEAEVAAQDRTVWRILTSQAASADMQALSFKARALSHTIARLKAFQSEQFIARLVRLYPRVFRLRLNELATPLSSIF